VAGLARQLNYRIEALEAAQTEVERLRDELAARAANTELLRLQVNDLQRRLDTSLTQQQEAADAYDALIATRTFRWLQKPRAFYGKVRKLSAQKLSETGR
jgi:predicted  nucleic acid-binding Zn-ribbon protein